MERRVVVLKTPSTSSSISSISSLDDSFIEAVNKQLGDVVAACGAGPPSSPLSSSPPLLRQLPGEEEAWRDHLQVTPTICSSSEVAASLHSLLSSLPSPSTCLTSLLWVCTSPPTTLDPHLYGALLRAVTWCRAHLLLLTPTSCSPLPEWVEELGPTAAPLDSLWPDTGLSLHLSPLTLWRGQVAFYHQDPTTGPGLLPLGDCELRCPPAPALPTPDAGIFPTEATRHLAPSLEVLSSPALSSLPRHLLTPHTLHLVCGPGKVSEYLTSHLASPGSSLLLRLSYSTDPPRSDPTLRSTEHWRSTIVDGGWEPRLPGPQLGTQVSSFHLLVHHDPLLRPTSSNYTTMVAVLLRPTSSLSPLLPRPSLPLPSATDELPPLVGLPLISVPPGVLPQVRRWVEEVRKEVVRLLPVGTEEVEELLEAVQEKVVEGVLGQVEVTVRALEEVDLRGKESRREEEGNPEDWQEKRFLRFLASHGQVAEQEREQREGRSLLAPSDHDWVLLEAKELVKFFDASGGSVRPLEEARPRNGNCPLRCWRVLVQVLEGAGAGLHHGAVEYTKHNMKNKSSRPQKSVQEYGRLMEENFDRLEGQDFQFSGFKFRGSNLEPPPAGEGGPFTRVEFTQYPDVYYNTGDPAERYDWECKERKDKLVGAVRETASTFSAVSQPQKLRVERRPSSTSIPLSSNPSSSSIPPSTLPPSNRRTSPRKRPEGRAAHQKARPPAAGGDTKRRSGGAEARSGGEARRSGGAEESRRGGGGEESRRGGGGEVSTDLSDVNRKKLRSSVYESLMGKDIQEKSPLFRPCFTKLFSIVKMYVIDQQNNESVTSTQPLPFF